MTTDLSVGLSAWVKTVAAITDLIGVADECRIYPVAVQGEIDLPYAIFTEERDAEPLTQLEAATLASSIVSFQCFGKDTFEASLLAQVFRSALTEQPFSGPMGPVMVYRPSYRGGNPAYQWDDQQFVAEVDFKFWYSLVS